jgi:hypothetical protein
MLDQAAALTVALWVLFTWVFEQMAETNPYLRIISPTPECGKSTLLKVIQLLSRRGWLVSNITPSAFKRIMQLERRSLLIDEGDAFLHENEIMRNLLDAASDPDTANASLSVKSGDDWAPTEINMFVPIAIASIGVLRKMQTVESRSIQVRLSRATAVELKQLAKGRRRELKAVLEPLAARCARWASDTGVKLKGARPMLPDELFGREQDKWEPLIAIADAISVEAGNTARLTAIAASAASDAADASSSIALLGDIRSLFDEMNSDKLSSKKICALLAAIEGRPWVEYGRAQKPISQNQLAQALKPFAIVPHTIRLSEGSTPKGYERKDFRDAFERYLPDVKDGGATVTSDSNRHNATTQRGEGENVDSPTATENACGTIENVRFPNGEKDCGSVADQNGRMHVDRLFPSNDEDGIDLYPEDDSQIAEHKP